MACGQGFGADLDGGGPGGSGGATFRPILGVLEASEDLVWCIGWWLNTCEDVVAILSVRSSG